MKLQTIIFSNFSSFWLNLWLLVFIQHTWSEGLYCKFPYKIAYRKYIKTFWSLICISKNLIWTTLKAIFSIFRFFLQPQIPDFKIIVSRSNIVLTNSKNWFSIQRIGFVLKVTYTKSDTIHKRRIPNRKGWDYRISPIHKKLTYPSTHPPTQTHTCINGTHT